MRILALGFPMPGPPIDNHSFTSAPSFFDYDAIVVDPKALSTLIEDVVQGRAEHKTLSGERVVNGPSGPDTVALADLLRDRRDETARLLARGGIVVCFAYANAVHVGVAGLPDCDRYCWLPAPDGLRYDEPLVRRGHGSEFRVDAGVHPFLALLAQLGSRLAYQAYFAEDMAGFDDMARVLARSTGGAAIAVELPVDRGRIVFLPPLARALSNEERYEPSNALQEAVRQSLRLASTSAAPLWIDDYPLPGLRERTEALREAGRRLTEAEETLAAGQAALDEVDRFERLLWQEGRYGLEDVARAALALLGFDVHPLEPDEPARVVAAEAGPERPSALLEVDASEEAVGLEGHYRLRQRLEQAIAQGKPARGVLIINGYRRSPPSERPPQNSDELRVVAERLRYCVATTEQLFHAVRAALEGDTATVAAFRDRLLHTEGILKED